MAKYWIKKVTFFLKSHNFAEFEGLMPELPVILQAYLPSIYLILEKLWGLVSGF